jgi:hypothetical protein
MQWLDATLQRTHKQITNYRDPAWVSDMLAWRQGAIDRERQAASGEITEEALEDILD